LADFGQSLDARRRDQAFGGRPDVQQVVAPFAGDVDQLRTSVSVGFQLWSYDLAPECR
jgi:hypothetical protein